MSRIGFVDRLQTIAATATITSAVWIVVGTVYLEREPAAQVGPASPTTALPASDMPLTDSSPTIGALTIPVQGVTGGSLVDSFGDERGARRHEAIDIMAPAGTAVIAAAPGTIEKLFASDAGGNTIYVRSGDRRTIFYYAHLQSYAPGLAEGQAVRAGQVLGAVGSSGNADPAAPHLHFEVLRTAADARWSDQASAINPYDLLVRAKP